jgi:hypothetical protein
LILSSSDSKLISATTNVDNQSPVIYNWKKEVASQNYLRLLIISESIKAVQNYMRSPIDDATPFEYDN